jgi:carbamoylphosphate synthase small subunit
MTKEDGYKAKAPKFHVVAYDFGIKTNILRRLASYGKHSACAPFPQPPTDAGAKPASLLAEESVHWGRRGGGGAQGAR